MLNADPLPDWEHQLGYLGFIPWAVMQKELLTNSAFQSFLTESSRSVRKGGMRKLCRNSRVALGELWFPCPGATQPGGTASREIKAGSLEVQQLPERCLSVPLSSWVFI